MGQTGCVSAFSLKGIPWFAENRKWIFRFNWPVVHDSTFPVYPLEAVLENHRKPALRSDRPTTERLSDGDFFTVRLSLLTDKESTAYRPIETIQQNNHLKFTP
jgi:hypothetical protein